MVYFCIYLTVSVLAAVAVIATTAVCSREMQQEQREEINKGSYPLPDYGTYGVVLRL